MNWVRICYRTHNPNNMQCDPLQATADTSRDAHGFTWNLATHVEISTLGPHRDNMEYRDVSQISVQ